MDPPFGQNGNFVLDTMLQRSCLGTKNIHLERMKTSVWWSMFLQILFLCIFILIIYFDIFHPVSSVMNWMKICISFNSLIKITLLCMVIFIQGEVCKKDYVNGPAYNTTRFQKIKRLFSVSNTLLLAFHIAIGLVMFWIYSSFPGGEYESLGRPCTGVYKNNLDYCLVERKLFLLFGGVWSGIYYFIMDYSFGYQILSFPLIQQLKIHRMKAALKGNICKSVKDSTTPVMISIFLYYLCGGYIRRKFMTILSVGLDSEPLDSVTELIDIKLIFLLWLFSSIFTVALQMTKLLFNVHLTEHCTFPVSTHMLPNANFISLVDSLKPANVPILNHLGFLDLFTLSTKYQERREELFTLSHPGGHPHSWKGIYCESMNLIQKFTHELNSSLQQSSLKKTDKILEKAEDITGFHFHSHGMRPLASPVFKDGITRMVQVQTPINQSAVEIAFNHFQTWCNVKLNEFCQKPFIAYFFAESPESRIDHLLLESQPVIWAVQSLAFLASASLTEDRYGIVQQDLHDIIVAILNLKVTLDKLFKQNLISKRTFANDPLDVQMKFRLRIALRMSLYRIAISFGPYIKDLKLPTDAELQLNNFTAFRELL